MSRISTWPTHTQTTAALMALFTLCWSSEAAACAVCFSGSDHSRWAYIGTTFFLSLLPLSLIGGVALWIWRLSRARAAG